MTASSRGVGRSMMEPAHRHWATLREDPNQVCPWSVGLELRHEAKVPHRLDMVLRIGAVSEPTNDSQVGVVSMRPEKGLRK